MNKYLNDFWPKNRFNPPASKELNSLVSLYPDLFSSLDTIYPNVFLFSLSSLKILSDSPFWIIRDGFVFLRHFFKIYPKPPIKFKSKLFIHPTLIQSVPAAWISHFGSFHFFSKIKKNTSFVKLIYHSDLPTLSPFPLSKTLKSKKKIGLLLTRQHLNFSFFNTEKNLIKIISDLVSKERTVEAFALDHFAQYPGEMANELFVEYNDAFLIGITSTFFSMINFNFSYPFLLKKKGLRELPINLNTSVFLQDDISFELHDLSLDRKIHAFVNAAYTNKELKNFPFDDNFARASFELWKIRNE